MKQIEGKEKKKKHKPQYCSQEALFKTPFCLESSKQKTNISNNKPEGFFQKVVFRIELFKICYR